MLVIRADASPEIGAGHFMRCIALAEAWRDRGGDVLFLTRCRNAQILGRAERTARVEQLRTDGGFDVDFRRTLELLQGLTTAGTYPWLCIDGYIFTPRYHAGVRAAGFQLLVIDDHAHLPRYEADVLLNQNLEAERLPYTTSEDTRCLFGPRYALLRSEFRTRSRQRRSVPTVAKRIVVTLGAGDPDNVTLHVIRGLVQCADESFECIVVVGGANANRAVIERAVSGAHNRGQLDIQIREHVDDMPALLAWADLAVSAAGSTCWELCYMRVPAVLITLAENQRGIAAGLGRRGAAVDLGWHDKVTAAEIAGAISSLARDPLRRSRMSRIAGSLVDGRGAERVVSTLERRAQEST